MSDFEDDEISMRRLFASLRAGWRTRTDIADRVRQRLDVFDERYAVPSPDRWMGRTLLSLVNAGGRLLGLGQARPDETRPDDTKPGE